MSKVTKKLWVPVIGFLLICEFRSARCGSPVDENLEYVSRECNQRLKRIDSIAKFRIFMEHFKRIDQNSLKIRAKSFFNTGDGRLTKCLQLNESLFELERLIDEGGHNICSTNYVDRLIDFHVKYLTKQKAQPATELVNDDIALERSSYLAYFFSLYASQIAYNCKDKLIERVQAAQSQSDCSALLFKFSFPNFDRGGKDDSGDEQDLENLAEFLRDFKRVENFAPLIWRGASMIENGPYIDVMLSNPVIDKIEELKFECNQRKSLYSALFSPIASLSQLGYSIDNPKVDSDSISQEDGRLLQCWLATAQMCQGILRTHLTASDDIKIDDEINSKLVSIKWGEIPDDAQPQEASEAPLRFDDVITEITPDVTRRVEKSFSRFEKLKAKALSRIKNFIVKYIDMDAIRENMLKDLLNNLDDHDKTESRVAFAGKEHDVRKFSPMSKIASEADTVVKLSSSFWNREIGLIVSSIVAVVMSFVFVWFSIYTLVTTLKQHSSNQETGNYRKEWKKMRDERVETMKEKLVKKKDKKSPLSFYKPQ